MYAALIWQFDGEPDELVRRYDAMVADVYCGPLSSKEPSSGSEVWRGG